MDKDEILKKSREQKEDEGLIFAENKGRYFGAIGFVSVFITLLFFNFFTGQDNYALFAMFWAYGAAEAYGKYRVTKKKVYLVSTIFGAVASLGFLANHMMNTLGVGA
jgi:hypothetical protein